MMISILNTGKEELAMPHSQRQPVWFSMCMLAKNAAIYR